MKYVLFGVVCATLVIFAMLCVAIYYLPELLRRNRARNIKRLHGILGKQIDLVEGLKCVHGLTLKNGCAQCGTHRPTPTTSEEKP